MALAVEVSKDDITHHLYFDEQGSLKKKSWEPNIVPDAHDEATLEIGP